MTNLPRTSSRVAAAAAVLAAGALTMSAVWPQDQKYPGLIRIEYEAPKDPSVKPAYDMAKGAKSLEMMQVIFSSFRLPEDLYLKYVSCNGMANTYFDREDDRATIRVCYEYLHSIYDTMPKEPTAEGIMPREAFTGQLLFAVAHEFGHAAFDIYNLPVLGRQEDAADQFATHFLLHFGGALAQRLIWGAAYSYKGSIKDLQDKPKVEVPIAAFSSDHGSPEQRFYNLMCIAYGFDPKIFAAVVEKGYLPEPRAKVCKSEYLNLSYAIAKLVGPHIDQDKAEKAHETTESWSSAPFWRRLDAPQALHDPQPVQVR